MSMTATTLLWALQVQMCSEQCCWGHLTEMMIGIHLCCSSLFPHQLCLSGPDFCKASYHCYWSRVADITHSHRLCCSDSTVSHYTHQGVSLRNTSCLLMLCPLSPAASPSSCLLSRNHLKTHISWDVWKHLAKALATGLLVHHLVYQNTALSQMDTSWADSFSLSWLALLYVVQH